MQIHFTLGGMVHTGNKILQLLSKSYMTSGTISLVLKTLLIVNHELLVELLNYRWWQAPPWLKLETLSWPKQHKVSFEKRGNLPSYIVKT